MAPEPDPDPNVLYKQGNYEAAAAGYTQLLQKQDSHQQDAASRSVLLSNRAACHLALQQRAAAGADCRAGLALNPLSAKLHFRLAKALSDQQADDVTEAAAEAAAAAALQLADRGNGGGLSADVLALYEQLSAATATRAAGRDDDDENSDRDIRSIFLPEDPTSIRIVSTAQELMQAVDESDKFPLRSAPIILAPGTYTLLDPLDGAAAGCTIVGLGKVALVHRHTHAAWVTQGSLCLINVQLVGSGRGAAVCVSPQQLGGFMSMFMARAMGSSSGPLCRLINCRVENYSEAGLLVCGKGAQAVLQGCSFRKCALHAIEVREGGSLSARNTTIDSCKQGVSAYGGAKSVQLFGCSISNTAKEGVLAAGSFENAATAAQHEVRDPRVSAYTSASHRSATEQAQAWGKAHGMQLSLTMSDCSLRGCGNFGVSVDAGAAALISRCRLEACDPYCVFIKGSSSACITASQFVFAGRSAKSTWARAYGGQPLAAAGEYCEGARRSERLVLLDLRALLPD